MKYTKKPVTIEAVQWKGDNSKECIDFCPTLYFLNGVQMKIPTLEGEMNCNKHDYIIKGVKGEFYPCKPDIFALTYNEASKQEDKEPN